MIIDPAADFASMREVATDLRAKLDAALATVERLRTTRGVWCEHHGQADGCGVALAEGRAVLAERAREAAEAHAGRLRDALLAHGQHGRATCAHMCECGLASALAATPAGSVAELAALRECEATLRWMCKGHVRTPGTLVCRGCEALAALDAVAKGQR